VPVRDYRSELGPHERAQFLRRQTRERDVENLRQRQAMSDRASFAPPCIASRPSFGLRARTTDVQALQLLGANTQNL
jgi:hypothetical protein